MAVNSGHRNLKAQEQTCNVQVKTAYWFVSTGREQCKVLFPYEAQNEDELSIKEGDIINIITKVSRQTCARAFASFCSGLTGRVFLQDCADAGWWMGEVAGRQGVFPDNFVKLLEVEKEVKRRRIARENTTVLPLNCVCISRDQRNLLPRGHLQPNPPQVLSHRFRLFVCLFVFKRDARASKF